MKKILRLVTTSVLTLTLVACGEASSSVSTSGTQTSSSVSSSVSNFANVSTITLSAASDTLTQTMGTQKAVVVSAALNANTNPSLALEWTVNGTKSNQTGRVFEFTPAAAGTFVIQAKVGSVVSNNITLTVGAAALVVEEIKFVDADTIEIKAPGGAEVTVSGNTVEPESYYDITKGIYVIELKTALVQGSRATVTLTRDGLDPVAREVLFDTRKIEVNAASYDGQTASATSTKIVKAADGAFLISRPHILNASGAINQDEKEVRITLKSTDLNSTALVAYKVERLSAPTGAPAFAVDQGSTAVTSNDAGGKFIAFKLKSDTPAGDYAFRITLGSKTEDFTVRVAVPVAELKITKQGTNDVTSRSGIVDENTVADAETALVKATDGAYEITKDFLTTTFKEFKFTFEANNVSVPANLLGTIAAPITSNPNQLLVSVAAPGGLSFMRTGSSLTQQTLPQATPFRNVTSGFTINQRVDSTTPVGDYVYNVRVLQLGTEIHKETVTIRVKDSTPSLDFVGTVTDPNALYWESVLSGTLLTSPLSGLAGTGNITSDLDAAPLGKVNGLYLDTDANTNKGQLYQLAYGSTAISPFSLKLTTGAPTTGTSGDKILNVVNSTFHTATANNVFTVSTPLGFGFGAAISSAVAGTLVDGGVFIDVTTGKSHTYTASTNTWAEATLQGFTFGEGAGDTTGITITSGDHYLDLVTGKLQTSSATTGYDAVPGAALTLGYGNTALLNILKGGVTAEGDLIQITSASAANTRDLRWTARNTSYDATGVDLTANTSFVDNTNLQVYNYDFTADTYSIPSDLEKQFVLANSAKQLYSYDFETNKLVLVPTTQKYFMDAFTSEVYVFNTDADSLLWEKFADFKFSGNVPTSTISGKQADAAPGFTANLYWLDTDAGATVANVLKRYPATDLAPVAVTVADGTIFNDITTVTETFWIYDSSDVKKWIPYVKTQHVLIDLGSTITNRYSLATLSGSTWDDAGAQETKVLAFGSTFDNHNDLKTQATYAAIDATALLALVNPTADIVYATPASDRNIYHDTVANKLMVLKTGPVTKPLTITNGVINIEKPLHSGLDALQINLSGVASNFQGLANPAAALAESFVGTDTFVRELVSFNKSYTGPMTLAVSNEANKKVAIEVGSGPATRTKIATVNNLGVGTSGGIANRASTQAFFDHYVSSGEKTTFTNAFALPLTSATTNGTYNFTLQVGSLSKTVAVIVASSTPSIEVKVSDLIEDKEVVAVGGKYNVTLDDIGGKAQVYLDLNLLNLRPATNSTTTYNLAYTLVRDFNGDWSDTRSDIVSTAANRVGNAGDLRATGISTVMHGITPTGTNASYLELTDIGEYKFNLTVGGASREFSIVVNSFPTLKVSAAYRGTTADADVAATTKETILNNYIQAPLGVAKLHVDFEGVNVGNVKYVKFVNATSGASPTDPTITETSTELSDLELKFTAGIARKVIDVPENQLGVQSVTAFLYNADKVNVGYAKFAYNINQLTPNVTVTATITTDTAGAGRFDTPKTLTPSVTNSASGNTTTNPVVATISAATTVSFDLVSDAILTKLAVTNDTANGTITLASVFNVTDSVAALLTGSLEANHTYRFTYTVTDGSGNSRSFFVNVVNPA